MNLPIIQSIVHGALRPNLVLVETTIDGKKCKIPSSFQEVWNYTNQNHIYPMVNAAVDEYGIQTMIPMPIPEPDEEIPYQQLASEFSKLPQELTALEKLCITHLSKYVQFDFENERPVCLSHIAPDDYTQIQQLYYPASIDLEIPQPTNPFSKFYHTIIKAEMTRVKFAMINFAEVSKSDIDTRGAVKETLKLIKSYSRDIINQSHEMTFVSLEPLHEVSAQDITQNTLDNNFYLILKQYLIKLYFEIVLMFQNILKPNDYKPFDDYIYQCYGNYPTAEQRNAFHFAALTQQTQQAIIGNQIESKSVTLLAELYKTIGNNTATETLKTVTTALENFVFLQHIQQPAPPFEQLINQDFVNIIIKEQKQFFKQKYEREEIAIDRANAIDEIIADLDLKPRLHTSLSIKSDLSNFLNQQKDVYLKEPSALFKVVIEKQAHEIKKKPQPTIKPMQIKTKLAIAYKYLAFLNGVNPKNNDRIMSEADYKLLVAYVEELIQKGCIPTITRKIQKANIPKTWIKYTLYLIHQELYSSIQDTWIRFMQAAFVEFSEHTVSFDTLKTKFSVYPSGYKQMVKTIEE